MVRGASEAAARAPAMGEAAAARSCRAASPAARAPPADKGRNGGGMPGLKSCCAIPATRTSTGGLGCIA